jgi:tRNA threonylcarbamoyl adenosine modification protein YeaZ
VSKRVLLLINTATVSGVIGIARNGLVLSEVPLELAAASNRVVAAIDEALAEAGCQLEELSKIVLVKGPGTFTGSRVGASIAKAVSYALPCALTSVTTLEAVAWTGLQTTATATVDGPVWAVLDARRHQFYVQEFVHCRGTVEPQGEGACLGPEMFDAVRRTGGLAVCAFALSAVPESQRPGQGERVVWKFNAYPTCRGILAAGVNASTEDPFTLEPVYLRTTEELFDRPKATS